MATFSVLIVTAAPPGRAVEAGGAFVKIDGREALTRSIELFLNRDNVKQVMAAFLAEDAEEAKRRHTAHFSFTGVKVVTGGPRWIDQLVAAKEKISPDVSHVIVHDGARPAVPYTDIDALMEAAEGMTSGGGKSMITLTTPSRNSLIEVDEGGHPLATRLAGDFVQMLTPQVYPREKFMQLSKDTTDLGGVHASEVGILKGSPLNIRLAGSGDASLVKAMIHMLPKPKIKASSPFEEAQW